jgi:arylsulfatase A-like enzyme
MKRGRPKKKKFKLTYFWYSSVLASALIILTIVSSIFSPILDLRVFVTSTMYSLLSIVVLISLAFVMNDETFYVGRIKSFFIFTTLLYTVAYIWANITFILTNQIIREQSLWFLYKIYPKTTLAFTFLFVFIIGISLVFVLHKKIRFLKIDKATRKTFSRINLICSFVLIGFIFVIPLMFSIFNPLVESYVYGNVIYVVPEKIESEKVMDIKVDLEKPNVVMILLESVSSERLGAYGYRRDVTPNIDYLAENGILFENAYTTATHSDYAQPTYLSSRYMIVNGYRNFFDGDHERKMAWDVFSEKNYTTVYFSSQDDSWAGMSDYYNFDSLDIYSYSLSDGEYDYGGGLAKKDYDHKNSERIVNWIESSGDEPFFLYANFQATHLPLSYPEEYAQYKPDDIRSVGPFSLTGISNMENRYDNSLSYVDSQVGKVVDSLKQSGKFDNTVIIISADHGHDLVGFHDVDGHGMSIYNDETRIPLIFYIPGTSPMRIEESVSHIDVLPTLSDLLGFGKHKEFLGDIMKKDNRIFFYTQNHRYLISMIRGDLKVIVDLNKKISEVYNIKEDPNEEHNLASEIIYDEEVLELLLWDHCQKEYFSKVEPEEFLEKYCLNF